MVVFGDHVAVLGHAAFVVDLGAEVVVPRLALLSWLSAERGSEDLKRRSR